MLSDWLYEIVFCLCDTLVERRRRLMFVCATAYLSMYILIGVGCLEVYRYPKGIVSYRRSVGDGIGEWVRLS